MCPPGAFPRTYAGFASYAEIYQTLQQLINGESSSPGYVITDVDPFKDNPSALRDNKWYFIPHKENSCSEHGSWKAEGTCEVFSNSSIVGWRTILVFYEGQVPHEKKTAWTMHEFNLTQKRMIKGSEKKELGMLCTIFLDNGKAGSDDFKKIRNPEYSLGAYDGRNQKSLSNDSSDSEKSTATKPQVNWKDKINEKDVADKLLNHCQNNGPEPDYVPEDGYMELQDLDTPLSPSSSSENSSCLSRSSDEYFDSLELLRDLEPKNNNVQGKTDEGFKFSIAEPKQPNEVLVSPPASGVVIEEILEADNRVPHSMSYNRSAAPKRGLEFGKSRIGKEGPSNHNASPSSSGHGGSSDSEKKSSRGRMKRLKKKYFCFMPF